ncbi:3-oxoacyl-ACP reductase [Legionella birminghamensis]|uniref:3-oxoacyl-ACP reductase n=1 Tax=Legionella birminghamensis TaxID=28083 RepID=A0A378I9P0_9GAMM|nr:SDR family NAD(P)-dependent oxidoreductase [Legionella birminghamensis]KTC75604.1 3-oxoacyl-ACP reductase [Legionella birminghamensis]STX31927.1 3-oxoacyl-ACP reductase [Legionella birminghamensis]
MSLNNQVAIVTGGASGMGLACVQALKNAGAKVAVWDKTSTDEGDFAISCDVSSESEVKEALRQSIEQLGVPGICINCAGIAPAKKMIGREGAMLLASFRQVIDINLVGTFNVMRLVAEAMISLPLDEATGERGVIINTASIAAFEGQIGQLAYSASKGGVVAMTLPAARELAEHAIRVNTIAPGLIATPLLLNMPQEVQERLAATVTFPKRLGKPEEFAALVMHIIENRMINGEVIRLDGALRMQAK